MSAKKNILLKRVLSIVMIVSMLCGCNVNTTVTVNGTDAATDIATDNSTDEAEQIVDPVEKEEPSELEIKDNDILYEDKDDTSILKMYLTVSSGNDADGSNHTWEEVSTYSAIYYEDLGVDRYKVEGVLQIDEGEGINEDSFGYGVKVPNVSVQVRGQSSSKAVIKNYKIRIKDGMGKFRGQRTLNLNKHQIDPYRFTNKMCYDMANSVPELIGGRTQFVQLFVKDETEGKSDKYVDYGLYTMVEQVNRTYLKSRNLDENGQLYKVSFFEWNKYDEIMVSYDSPDFDQKAFEEKLEIKGDKDNSKLNEIVEKLNNKMTPIDEIVDEHFNAENICYWMAFNILIGNYDSGPRNLFLYSPLNSEKFYFICWDMDASFRKEYLIVKDHSDGLSWLRGMSQYLGLVLANRMFKEEKYRDMLTDAIEDIHTNYVNQNIVNEYASEYSKLTKPFLYGGADSDNAKLHAEDFDRLVACLGDEVEENYEYYYEMMNAPWPFFVGFPERDGDKMILNWDASYDVNGESVSYDYKLARDYYFNDIISEGEDLIAPSVVIDELDPGVYFLRVVATNESGYSQDCFDYCSISGIGKVYACLAFEIKQDGSIIEYTEPKSN